MMLVVLGFPDDASSKEPSRQCSRPEMRVLSLGREDLLEEGQQPTAVFLSGESHGQRNLAGYSPQGLRKSNTTEVT